MRSLFVRIWLTVLVVLALFALSSSWLWNSHVGQERARVEQQMSDRVAAWADLIERSLPAADAPVNEQATALRDWSYRLRMPMALADMAGARIAASESFLRMEDEGFPRRPLSIRLGDGRTLWFARPGLLSRLAPPDGRSGLPFGLEAGMAAPGVRFGPDRASQPGYTPRFRAADTMNLPPLPFGLSPGVGLSAVLAVLFVLIAAAAYPVVRGLTRRLEDLRSGVEAFGGGALGRRVSAQGSDEVAVLARSFNSAAERIEGLVQANQSLLANASHELRSPLARLKMAVSLYVEAPPEQRDKLLREINSNVAELDALVEEVLLASRLDAARAEMVKDRVDLAGMAAEEAARVHAEVQVEQEGQGLPLEQPSLVVQGDERLLRRALRNLLENALRYGGGEVAVRMRKQAHLVQVTVCDRGPGIPQAYRERVFEAFFRLPGHAEREGGVGLGLSLVRQIVQRHGGSVRCEQREGGGSCFVLSLPAP